MKRYICKLFCVILGVILLLGAIGCDHGTADPGQTDQTDGPKKTGEDTVDVVPDGSEEHTPAPLATETPEPTEEPTPEPAATRPPKEGDVSTGRFPDSDTGADADWSYQSDELRIAIKRYEDEEEMLAYYVADIWIRNISSFRMGFGNGAYNTGREEPEDFSVREHAIFAVNGTMNSGLVIQNGEQVKKSVENRDHIFRSGVVIVYRDGSVKLINRDKRETYKYDTENSRNGGIWHALQFGPVLVQNGEIISGLNRFSRRARTVFGYCEPGHYIFLSVDDTRDCVGMTMEEMADLMASLGCTDAINLDGGQSTSMTFMGKRINAKPDSDRRVSDMLLFAEYDAEGNAPELTDVTPDKVYGE